MFEKRKRNKRYRELMENGSIYNIKEFIISVYNREEILNKEQIYNLLLKVQLDSNISTNLQQEAYFLVKPLTTKYVVPQYLADMLNSRTVLNNLTEQ